ncbi:hypothetical protein BK715_07115 [Bacillus thuringiensis serovar japonensis]|nr:hypothetical protein BK713_08660 [Bacillus thuringiensis serovar jinghongiensis]OTW84783.1 hypothetical protein BK710_15870 [Bacillus thuringiensis serovar sumiyoshiensis]OTX08734.1 hypothetical protein BK711_02195 [Bacillus thuringiensis serovar fukuokaensis]OTX21373.1 hypothetical protein BK715_07115 [Bacillus thuringiensis serovar japonensis]
MRLFVGLDVNSFDIKTCVLNGEGEKLDSFSVNKDFPGAIALKERLLQREKTTLILVHVWYNHISTSFKGL